MPLVMVSSENLTEFDGLPVGSVNVEVADAAIPEGGDGLDAVFLDLQPQIPGILIGGFDIRGIQGPMIDGSSGQRGLFAFPGLDGQVTITHEGATVLSVGEDSHQLETELGGIEVNGLIQVMGNHA